MVTATLAVLAVGIGLQRLWELRRSGRNRTALLARGGRELASGHYPLFFALHSSWLVGWVVEALTRGPAFSTLWPLLVPAFAAAEMMRLWAISSLGVHWTTRVIALPGAGLVRRGPYHFLAHPNYLAVAVELAAVPLLFGAWITAAAATLANAALLLGLRLPAEKEALRIQQEG